MLYSLLIIQWWIIYNKSKHNICLYMDMIHVCIFICLYINMSMISWVNMVLVFIYDGIWWRFHVGIQCYQSITCYIVLIFALDQDYRTLSDDVTIQLLLYWAVDIQRENSILLPHQLQGLPYIMWMNFIDSVHVLVRSSSQSINSDLIWYQVANFWLIETCV